MALRTPRTVVREFIDAVNGHDPQAIVRLLSSDHVFTDAVGNKLSNLGRLERAWRGYLDMFPDYHIEVETLISSGSTVAVFGIASGAYAGSLAAESEAWRVPAAWRAVVKQGLVVEWQVYADNKRVYEILSASEG